MKLYRVAFYSTVKQRKATIVRIHATSIDQAKVIVKYKYDAIHFQYVERVTY